MDYSKPFSYMFEDKDWMKKFLIGALMMIFIFFGWMISLGYIIRLARNTREGKEIPLPEWDNIGDKFIDGLKCWVVAIIYSIPGILLGLIPCLGAIIGLIWFLIVTPMGIILYLKYGDIGKALNFSEALEKIKLHWQNILLVSLMNFVFGIIAVFGLLGFCIGVFLTAFWATLAFYQLIGQLAREIYPLSYEPIPPSV